MIFLYQELNFTLKIANFPLKWNVSNFQSDCALGLRQISPKAKPTKELASTCQMQRCSAMDNSMLLSPELVQQNQFPFSNPKVNYSFFAKFYF